MPVMKAYLDESGSKRVFTIAAYLATGKKWEAFGTRWAEILKAAGLEGPFHMTDYESRFPPFDKWSPEKRVRVICDLIDTINSTVDCALICRMPLALLEVAIPKKLRGKKFLYMACFHSIYIELLKISKINSLDRMPLFIDRNREVSSHVRAIDERLRDILPEVDKYLTAPVFDDKAYALPLQAADILAYEAMKNADNLVQQNGYTRRSFQRLDRKRYGYHDHNEDSILELAKFVIGTHGTEYWEKWLNEEGG